MAEHAPAPTLCLFGDWHPEISALIGDSDFQALVGRLFESDEAAAPETPPGCFERAARLGLFVLEGGAYRAGPRLVPIPSSAERDLPELMRPVLAHYVEIVGDVSADLRAAYELSRTGKRFPWETVWHSVVAGMFLDLAMGSELVRSGAILRQAVGETVVWAFEGVSADNGFGVQSIVCPASRSLYSQLWHRKIRRRERLGVEHVRTLAQLAFAGDGISDQPRELLYLRHLRFVRRSGSSFEVELPAFAPDDAERLLGVLMPAARRLVTDAIVPALATMAYHSWWRPRAREDRFRHAAVRLILEYGVDRVIASGLLPPFPDDGDLPVAWGRWLWSEPAGGEALIPDFLPRGQTHSPP